MARRRSLRSSSISDTGPHCDTDDSSEDNPTELDHIKKPSTRPRKTPTKQTRLTDKALLDICGRKIMANREALKNYINDLRVQREQDRIKSTQLEKNFKDVNENTQQC